MKALQVRIRKVRKSDIDRIVDIERSWHHLSHWSIDSYYRLLNDDNFTSSFVAEIDEADTAALPSSDLSFFTSLPTSSEIYNIAVESGYARSGIGKQLMKAAIEESSRKKGAKESCLKSGNPTIRPSTSTSDSISGSWANVRTTIRIPLKMRTSWSTRFRD